ncbi:TetR/AcrR family transcriptional regulator [Granulosicoccus antarcticus]|nr:TetR/AcrR family transcriptional regulator [Granulosicoccus antarcticus]
MTDNRTKLVDAAQDRVQSSGLKALSFRTLADQIGIKSSSVHYHFPEKADLAQALIERYSLSMSDSLSAISNSDADLRGKLEAFIGIFEAVARRDKICLCGMLTAEVELLSDTNKQALQVFFHDMEHWLCSLFDAHLAEMKSPLSHLSLAKAMISGLEGALLVDRVAGNTHCMNAQKKLFLSMLIA